MYSVVWRRGRGLVALVTPGNPLPSGFRCTNWAGIFRDQKKKMGRSKESGTRKEERTGKCSNSLYLAHFHRGTNKIIAEVFEYLLLSCQNFSTAHFIEWEN